MAGKKGMKIKKTREESQKFAEYYELHFPTWTKEQCEEAAIKFKKSSNWQCIEYYEKQYPGLSHEEHIKLKEQALKNKRENSKTNILYWQKRYPEKSLEELEELRSKEAKSKNKCNLEYWINKYPEKSLDEIKKLHNNHYQSWLSHQEGWGKGEKNHNHRNNASSEQRCQLSPRNIAFYERKYPELSHEEHIKLRQEFITKNNIAIKNTVKQTNIEYYLNQGMNEEEARIALHNRQATFTLEKCILKYGEIEGNKIFSNRQQKWLKSLYNSFQNNGDGRSKQSKFAKHIIKECCKYFKIPIPKHEKYIYWKNTNQAFAYDFMINNKIIEFQGDYWHCNPKLYEASFYNKVKQLSAEEIWKYDKVKKECAEYYGYKILYIWEYDYNQNSEETLQKCIDFINS